MKYDVQLCEVLRRAQTAENTFDYTVLAPKLAEVAQPGQFAHIYVPGKTLRRPISICDIDKKNGTLRFVFQIRGAGTEQLSKFEVGDKMDVSLKETGVGGVAGTPFGQKIAEKMGMA